MSGVKRSGYPTETWMVLSEGNEFNDMDSAVEDAKAGTRRDGNIRVVVRLEDLVYQETVYATNNGKDVR